MSKKKTILNKNSNIPTGMWKDIFTLCTMLVDLENFEKKGRSQIKPSQKDHLKLLHQIHDHFQEKITKQQQRVHFIQEWVASLEYVFKAYKDFEKKFIVKIN